MSPTIAGRACTYTTQQRHRESMENRAYVAPDGGPLYFHCGGFQGSGMSREEFHSSIGRERIKQMNIWRAQGYRWDRNGVHIARPMSENSGYYKHYSRHDILPITALTSRCKHEQSSWLTIAQLRSSYYIIISFLTGGR